MKFFSLIILSLCTFSALAEDFISSQYDFCTVEGHPFLLGFFGPNWTGSTKANAQTLNFPGESAEPVPGKGLRRLGIFKVGVHGTFDYEEIKLVAKDKVELEAKLKSEKGIAGESLSFQLSLPLNLLKSRPVIIDGNERKIGLSLSDWRYQTKDGNHTVTIPMERGTLTVSGKFRMLLQDNRRFGTNTFSLRLLLPGYPGKVKKTGIRLKAQYQPYPVNRLKISDKTAEQSFGGIAFSIAKDKGVVPENLTAQISGTGGYLYILSSLDAKAEQAGQMKVKYKDGSSREFKITANSDGEIFFNPAGKNKIYAFDQENGPKLYLTRINLGKQALAELSFSTQNHWLIKGVSLSGHEMQPQFKEGKYIVKPGKNWVPFPTELDIIEGSALDFSGLLDAPAGKYGYVKVKDGNFVFEKRPDKPVRFWGTNLTSKALFMSKVNAERVVKRLAMCGYNLIRIHHFDDKLTDNPKDSTVIDQDKINKLDYLLAICKKYGVYVSLDMFTTRKMHKGEIADFPDRKLSRRDYKALLIVNDATMRNLEAFEKNLLTHKNPYTGMTWAEDPVIANISLINEGVLNSNIRSKFVQNEFNKAYENYKKSHPETTKKQFMHNLYAKAYKRMTSFVRSLGVKVPFTDLNYTYDHLNVYFDRRNLDYVDIHYYWAHPDKGGVPRSFRPDSALNNFGGISSLFGSRFLDRPFAISEWSYVFPNAYRCEGGFLAGAYFSLQGYAMPCRFNYASNQSRATKPTIIIGFEQANDPASILSDRAGALFYLRNDVEEAKETCAILLEKEQYSIPPHMQILGMIFKTGCVFNAAEANRANSVVSTGSKSSKVKVPQFATLSNPHLLKSMSKAGVLTSKLYNPKNNQINSSTGQLFFDGKKHSFKALTSRSEGFVSDPGNKLKGKFADVEISGTFSSVLVAALDKAPLEQSKRILLLHLTDCQNNKMQFSDSKRHTVENYGTSPILLRRGKVNVELKETAAGKAELYSLALSGKRLKRIPTEVKNGKLCFTMDNSSGVFAYELLIK